MFKFGFGFGFSICSRQYFDSAYSFGEYGYIVVVTNDNSICTCSFGISVYICYIKKHTALIGVICETEIYVWTFDFHINTHEKESEREEWAILSIPNCQKNGKL